MTVEKALRKVYEFHEQYKQGLINKATLVQNIIDIFENIKQQDIKIAVDTLHNYKIEVIKK